jgi:hypothetical protein
VSEFSRRRILELAAIDPEKIVVIGDGVSGQSRRILVGIVLFVIASAATRSRGRRLRPLDCFVAYAPRD